MKTFTQSISTDDPEIKNSLAVLESLFDIPCEKICVFDIETTGLSAKVSNVYLIGLMIISKTEIKSIQLFADDYTSEQTLLEEFDAILADMDAVLHFNGTTFDIPYLEEKYKKYNLASPFIDLESIDLYKLVGKKRHIFPTENLKLVSVEKLVGYDRGDDSDGGECIRIYTEYMTKKYAGDEAGSKECMEIVLKHNHDDIIGTLLACQALAFVSPVFDEISIDKKDDTLTLIAKLTNGIHFPASFAYNYSFEKSKKKKSKNSHSRLLDPGFITSSSDYSSDKVIAHMKSLGYEDNYTIVLFCNEFAYIVCPIITDEKYFFYDDHKDYFYLPDEDKAIHKSVGIYVDPAHRKKATAANCYTRKQGQFIQVPLTLSFSDAFYDKEKKDSGKYLLTDTLSNKSSAGLSDITAEIIREFTLP